MRFRVDYGNDAIEALQQLVEDSPSSNSKIVFTGHRGSGKSTLLAEFSRRCDDRYFVVFFSISDAIEMSDVNHINVLFAIAVNLMSEAEKQQVQIPNSTKEQFYKWFATKTRTDIKSLGAEGSLGLKLLKAIGFKLKAEAVFRDEIKQEFKRDFRDLIANINIIAATINTATNKEVIVIVDDLDKIDLAVAKEIYQDNIKSLFQPNFRIILTIPTAALRQMSLIATIETETDNQIIPMAVPKLFGKGERTQPNSVPKAEPKALLEEVLSKRMNSELIEPQVVEQIVIYSGGVLRELIRITNECCRICLRLIRRAPQRTDIKIDEAVLKEAIKKLRIDFSMRLGTVDYEILTETYRKCMPKEPTEQRFLDLLHGLYVLEYRNDRLWYDVHPIVTELLQEQGLV